MLTKLARTLLFASTLASPAAALAQNEPPPPPPPSDDFVKVREACRPDVERFCKDVPPGGGRIRQCLKAHRAELSDVCKSAIAEARQHHHPRP
jgi:hypothetical protein